MVMVAAVTLIMYSLSAQLAVVIPYALLSGAVMGAELLTFDIAAANAGDRNRGGRCSRRYAAPRGDGYSGRRMIPYRTAASCSIAAPECRPYVGNDAAAEL